MPVQLNHLHRIFLRQYIQEPLPRIIRLVHICSKLIFRIENTPLIALYKTSSLTFLFSIQLTKKFIYLLDNHKTSFYI